MSVHSPSKRFSHRPDRSRCPDTAGQATRQEPGATPPPRHKMALVTWVGAYIVITALLGALGPTMSSWPLPLRTLLLSVLMVGILTWAVIPALTRVFGAWLRA